MKITCQSCQAKYTIADEKVLGKIVKIRCKKCSATIVVNGSDPSGAPAYEAAPQPSAGSDESWTINVAEGDQRTMTDAEVVSAFQTGLIGDETFCWKDGMSDWLPLREIETLYAACKPPRAVRSAPPAQQATRAQGRSSPPAPEVAAAAGHGIANGGAARRQGGRAPGADLFQGAAQAGGEEEVMTSAPAGAPQAFEPQKPTGARNENSVLFSLSALTSKGTDRPPAMPGVEASGLIDIRQLSAQMGRGDDKKRSRVDDIMNLSSGGAFNGALAAPTLTAPAIDQYGPPATETASKNKGLIFMALGAGAFVIVGAVGVTMLLMRGKGTDADSAAASTSAAGLTASASASVAAAAESAAAPNSSASAPEATAAATDSTASASASGTPPAAPAAATTTAAAAAAAATPKAQAQTAPATAPAHSTAAAPAGVPAALAAAAQADQPFNMGEAKSKLAAAAASAQTCKKGDTTGTGHAVIVFAPNGGAQSVTINGPPFEGTPVGACVAARFKSVHVPAFSGSPFSVSKSFTIN